MAIDRIGEEIGVIGRVIEAKVAQFSAECYELHTAPDLGTLVTVENPRGEIYAVVSDVMTASVEPGRRPVAHMPPDADADAILEDNPQLKLLLKTTFDAIVIAFRANDGLRQHLPPAAARIFARVRPCSAAVVRQLTEEPQFLKPLISGSGNDEVIAACLRQAAESHPDPVGFRVRAGKELLRLLGNEPDRLTAILRSIEA
jgi:hypothetical protein